MAKDKPLTKTELVKTLKEIGVATKDDVRQIVKEMGVATKNDLKSELGKSERRLERRLVIRMNKMGRTLQQSIADLAETTPTRQEFEILKHSGNYGLA
jgi:uncharacterized SAM-dependent methyltransferase